MHSKVSSQNEWFLPGAIVLAGIILAGAIYITRHHAPLPTVGDPEAANPVSLSDHVYGNPAAPIVIIEYADIDSSYSKDFQQVMEEVMANYGPSGNVAWVYRHFPLSGADPNDGEHAEAAECVAALGGTPDFFKFIDAIQAAAPGDNIFDPSGYDTIVSGLGISTGSFNSCLSAHTYQKVVAEDYNNAVAVGATGSPYNILEVRDQKPIVISGSVPYDTMKEVLDQSIAKVLDTSGNSGT